MDVTSSTAAIIKNGVLSRQSVRQFLVYGMSVTASMVSSFAVVLILVRLLPADAYASVVLTKVSLLVVTSLGGLGLSQAAVRWINLRETSDVVLGTVLAGAAFLAVPSAILMIGLMLTLEGRLGLPLTASLTIATIALVLGYMINNELVNWARAQHQSGRHAVLSTIRAVLQVGAVTLGVLLMKHASGYIYGLATAELTFSLLLLGKVFKHERPCFQHSLFGDMLRYGWPHTLVIASGFLLTYVDRYMLAFMVDDTAVVAYYDASYMVVSSVLALIVRPFNLFLFPAYVKLYAEKGSDATMAMLRRAQHTFLVMGLVLATVVILVREQILLWLFPYEYSVASSIFAAVAFGTILNGVFMAAVAGLYLSDRTLMVGLAAVVALIVNVGANMVLIPLLGIDGAALSTALASLTQLIVGYHYSKRILPIGVPYGFIVAGALWMSVVHWVTM